jgi:putative aminopeptidase FrvX
MKIIISAHMDLARPVMSIKMDDKNLVGLVDNFAGVFASYQASRRTGVSVQFTNYEELDYDGADTVAKQLDKDTIVFVVDTILEKDVKGKLVSITNAYGLGAYWDEMKKEFGNNVCFIDGFFEQKEDETWIYGNKHKLKTFYLGVPIPGDYYHSTELAVNLKTIDKVTNIIVDLIKYFQGK